MLQTGMILNQRYEIVRLIARGGMGAVYEGRDLKFGGAPVAIKRCLPANESMQRAFAREAELLANLAHPGVPKVRDTFAEAEARYLVMEYIPGRDLEEILKDRGTPIPTEEALEWMDQALDALSYMHRQQPPVIHRDIKTSNLKLTPLGHVMLIDFGLSKENGDTSLVGYSVNFAPLEQLQGDGTDARSDLYSLGATIYRLLTGLAPETALNRLTQIAKDHRDPLPRVNAINSQVPAAVAQVIWEAMALQREDRLQSADEMRRRLLEARKSQAENFQLLYTSTEAIQAANTGLGVSGLTTNAKSIAPSRGESVRESWALNAQGPSLAPGLNNIGTNKTGAKNTKLRLALSLVCLVAFAMSIGAGVNYWKTGQEAARQKAAQQKAEQDEIAKQQADQLALAQAEAERQNGAQLEAMQAQLVALQGDAEKQRQIEAQQQAADQKAEKQRQEAERREAERQRQETARREAAQKEADRQRQEAERRELARQKQEAERREFARQRQEAERQEVERQIQEAERREAARQRWEAERQEADRQRREAERREAERQRWAAERREAQKQRWAAEQREAEKKEAEKQKAKKEAKEKRERDSKDRLIKGAIIGGISITSGILNSQKAKNKAQP